MPSNNTGHIAKELFSKYPDRLALLLNPRNVSKHQLKYRHALDNDCFNKFNEDTYFNALSMLSGPMFTVCPDVVGCHDRTLALWYYYYPKIKEYGFPVAFVAQNGCKPELVPSEADWVFVGGTDPWKMENVSEFSKMDIPCHVGRVNMVSRLKTCEDLGVSSVDGTGWVQFNNYQTRDLKKYLSGEDEQCSLF